MQNIKIFFLISSFIFVRLVGAPSALITGHENLDVWAHECFDKVREYSNPAYENGTEGDTVAFPEPIINYTVFEELIRTFNGSELRILSEDTQWVDGHSVKVLEHKDHSFAQARCICPMSVLVSFGDIHGSIHSLLRNLLRLKDMRLNGVAIMSKHYRLAPDCFFVCLGDYVDRGRYSVEVLYTLLRLKIANPRQVFFIRGNHEISHMIERYGLLQELAKKYVFSCNRAWRRCLLFVDDFFSLMPSVLFVGCGDSTVSFLQFCHGGLGVAYNECHGGLVDIEVDPLLRNVAQTHAAETLNFYLRDCPVENGFMWNDFSTECTADGFLGDGFTLARKGASVVIQGSCLHDFLPRRRFDGGYYGIDAVIRGHGHRPGGVWQLQEHVPGSWRFLDHEIMIDDFCADSGAYPVFTVMSGAEGIGVNSEGFALISFNSEQNKWHLCPYAFARAPEHAEASMAHPRIVVTPPSGEEPTDG